MLSHTEDKLHSCGMCGKSFTVKDDFSKHIHIHFGDNIPNRCLTCGKSFSRKGSLTQHMLIHSGDKLNKCVTYGKSFTLKASLVYHMLIHSGVNLTNVKFVENHLYGKPVSFTIC